MPYTVHFEDGIEIDFDEPPSPAVIDEAYQQAKLPRIDAQSEPSLGDRVIDAAKSSLLGPAGTAAKVLQAPIFKPSQEEAAAAAQNAFQRAQELRTQELSARLAKVDPTASDVDLQKGLALQEAPPALRLSLAEKQLKAEHEADQMQVPGLLFTAGLAATAIANPATIPSLVAGSAATAMATPAIKAARSLLPDNLSGSTNDALDLLETVAQGIIFGKAAHATPGMIDAFTKVSTEAYNLPKTVFIEPAKIRSIFQTGEAISPDELDMVKSLGLNGEQYRQAVQSGLKIEVPTEKVVHLADRPWWATLKRALGIEPVDTTMVERAGAPRQAPAGSLEAPKNVIAAEPGISTETPLPGTQTQTVGESSNKPAVEEAAGSVLTARQRQKLVDQAGGPETMTRFGKVGELSDEDLMRIETQPAEQGRIVASLHPEPIEETSAAPIRPANKRWHNDPGSQPGEPALLMDSNDPETASAVIIERVNDENRVLYEAVLPGGQSLGHFPTVEEAQVAAEKTVAKPVQEPTHPGRIPQPEEVASALHVEQAAQEAATSKQNDLPQPTEAQKEAGNYQKGHISLHGLDISIENPRGSIRSGTDKGGKEWSITMRHHYGYIRGTTGKDGDHVDVFIGPDPASEKVFVIDQVNPSTGKFDEHKAMLGFDNSSEAARGYLANYAKDWKGFGNITPMEMDEFKEWVTSRDAIKPAADADLVVPAQDDMPKNLKTPEDKAFYRALHSFESAEQRWDKRRKTGLSDAELLAAIGEEFGMQGGFTSREFFFNVKGGKTPKYWFGRGNSYGKQPTLHGKVLVNEARRVLQIPKPGAGAIERYQWMRNAQGGQKFGNQEIIRPMTEEDFQKDIKPKLRKDYANTLKEYQANHPEETHISYFKREDSDWIMAKSGSLESLRPNTQDPNFKKWVKKVESFESPEAVKHGQTADQPVAQETAKKPTIKKVVRSQRLISDKEKPLVQELRDAISGGEAGRRIIKQRENEPGHDVIAIPSTFPDFFKNKGYTKAESLQIIDNVLAGKLITEKQRVVFDDLLAGQEAVYEQQLVAERETAAKAGAESAFSAGERAGEEEAELEFDESTPLPADALEFDPAKLEASEKPPVQQQIPGTQPGLPSHKIQPTNLIQEESLGPLFGNVEPPKPTEAGSSLSERAERFASENKADLIDKYEQRFGRVINGDSVRELFTPVGYDRTNGRELGTAPQKLTDEIYQRQLDKHKNDAKKSVILTGGGNGSGKSKFISGLDAENRSTITLDSTLSNYEASYKNIQRALDAGYMVEVVFISRDPTEAFVEGVVRRMKVQGTDDTGRVVTVAQHARSHIAARGVVRKLAAAFGDKITVKVLVNRNQLFPSLQPVAFDAWQAPEYTKEQLTEKLTDIVEAYAKNGKITEKLRNVFLPPSVQAERVEGAGTARTSGAGPSSKPAPDRGRSLEQARQQEKLTPEDRGAPGGTAEGGGYARLDPPSDNIGNDPTEFAHLDDIDPLEMPEIVTLQRAISGQVATLKFFKRAFGRFYPALGQIRLHPWIFLSQQAVDDLRAEVSEYVDPDDPTLINTKAEGKPPQSLLDKWEWVQRNWRPGLAEKVLAHEIGHMIDWLPDKNMKRGNAIGRAISSVRKFMKETFSATPLFSGEQEDLKNSELKAELKALTQYWKPFDESKVKLGYKKYRYSSVELYADFMSVLLNDPAQAKRLAPKFYKAFFDNLDKKPEVKAEFFRLQRLLHGAPKEVLAERAETITESFEKASEIFAAQRAQELAAQKSLWWKIKQVLFDQHLALLEKRNKVGKLSPDEDPRNLIEERDALTSQIAADMNDLDKVVYQPLTKAGLDWDQDFGAYMFLTRVIGERHGIANPFGQTPKTAQDQLEFMREQLGEEKFSQLEESAGKMRKWFKGLNNRYPDMFSEEQRTLINGNDFYAPFQVLDYLDEWIAAGIIHQVGTLKDINNPGTAMALKAVSLITAGEKNVTKKKVLGGFLLSYFNGDGIEEAKVQMVPIAGGKLMPHVARGPANTEPILWRDNGHWKAAHVDEYIAASFTHTPDGTLRAVGQILADITLNQKIFRPFYITFNLGFQSNNLARDFLRAWRNIPDASFSEAITSAGKLLAKYREALPHAIARTKGAYDPVIQKMLTDRAINITLNQLIHTGATTADEEIEVLRQRYGQTEAPAKQGWTKPVHDLLDAVEYWGNVIETVPKVAGYLRLDQMNAKERAYRVRNHIGTPNWRRKGSGYVIYNNAWLFSNIAKEAWRGDYETAFKDPKTRAGYWWKMAMTSLFPKVLMAMAAYGLWGKALQNQMESASEYLKTNYTVIPLGEDPVTGKAILLTLPQDEQARTLGGLFWKLMFSTQRGQKGLTDIATYPLSQAVPSAAPMFQILSAWYDALRGRSPRDQYRGQDILTEDELKAGGVDAFWPLVRWTINQTGMTSFELRARAKDEPWLNKMVAIAPVVNRFIRITDYGITEQVQQMGQPAATEEAQEHLRMRRELAEAFRKHLTEKEVVENARKELIEKFDAGEIQASEIKAGVRRTRMAYRGLMASNDDPVARALRGAKSWHEQVPMVEHKRKDFDSTKAFDDYVNDLFDHGLLTRHARDVLTKTRDGRRMLQ